MNLSNIDMKTAILTLSCPDKSGLVARVSGFLHEKKGNIVSLNEFVDSDSKTFFLRVAWDLSIFEYQGEDIKRAFSELLSDFDAEWEIHFSEKKLKVALFVSKYDHCLRDILWRYNMGEFEIEIPVIISNHNDLKEVADRYSIPYYHFPLGKDNKEEIEKKEIALLNKMGVHTIVLARYMQILSSDFVSEFPKRIINIHHSFLPAFIGGNPYRQAFERGVKIIGATSHIVTNALDEGPIIVQATSHISHRDMVQDLIRKGRDLERVVLSRALKLYSERRGLVSGNKTVVFE